MKSNFNILVRQSVVLILVVILGLFTHIISGQPQAPPTTAVNNAANSKITHNPAPPVLADKKSAPIASGNVGVTEFIMEGEVEDIQWVGPRRRTVLVLTTANNLYRSSDEGKTWLNVVTSLKAFGTNKPAKTPKVKKLVVSPVDPNCVFVVGQGINHWVTKNAGRTFEPVNSIVKFHDVIMHPTDKESVLASSMAAKCHDTQANGVCYKSVYATSNFGKTWIKATDYVVQFDWAHNLGNGQAKHLPSTAMFATVFREKTGNQRFGYWDKNIDFVRTDDFFKTPAKVLVQHGNRFLFTKKFLFVAQVNPLRDTEVELQMSSDGANTFLRGTLPYKIKQHSYTILDTSQDTVFLHVNHEGEGAKWGNVYISNADGLNYTLSLPHNSREATGKCDFEKVEGLEGIYLANFIDKVGEDADDTTDDNTIGSEKSGGKKQIGKKPPPKIRTVITFDKGGVWSYLHAPKVDADGKKIDCSSVDCSLHLHGVTDEWGPFYSTDTSLGLIMATGNIGTSLSDNEDEINTYFSRDAGLSWDEVAKGSHIYEFGDHGALIVMANDVEASDTVYYSWNEGASWSPFKFSEKKLEIDNIIIEPTATSQKFMVYGSRKASKAGDKNEKPVGAVYFLDFSELHARKCKGVEAPGTPDSDYERWSPSDGRLGDKCLLGHQITYVRRKRDSQCFNGQKLDRMNYVKDCACTENDYECDVGYTRKMDGGPCTRVDAMTSADVMKATGLPPSNCPSGTTYKVSNGYRKVAGDTCTAGVDRNPSVFDCPHWTTTVSHGGWLVLLLLLCIVCGFAGVTMKKKSQNTAQGFDYSFSSNFNSSASGIMSMCSCFTRCFRKNDDYSGYSVVGNGGALPESAMGYDTYDDGLDNEDDFDDDDDDDEEDAVPMPTPQHERLKPLPNIPLSTAPIPKLSAPDGDDI
jgi:hypothetical protein